MCIRPLLLGLCVVMAACSGEEPAAADFPPADEACAILADIGYTCYKGADVFVFDTGVKKELTPGNGVVDCTTSPGSFGCPCTDNDQCNDGFCVPARDGTNVCTQTCIDECPGGWSCKFLAFGGADAAFICIQDDIALCRPCNVNTDCNTGGFGNPNDRCVRVGDVEGSFCGTACASDTDCQSDYSCKDLTEAETGVATRQCMPTEGECECSGRAVVEGATTECIRADICHGTRACTAEGLTACSAIEPGEEDCNGVDDNCNGVIDEGYVNTDGDSLADCTDPDDDNDGDLDEADNCPLTPNPDQIDADNDGLGDPCDKAQTPLLVDINPPSPANENNPVVTGTAEPGAFVQLFADPFCGSVPLATAIAAENGSFTVALTVLDDTTTNLHANAIVSSALPSDCTAIALIYIEDSTAPTSPRLLDSSPVSPSGQIAFTLLGDGEPASTVWLFAGTTCEGDPIAEFTPPESGALDIPLVATPNATSTYTALAKDVAGNTSECSLPFDYAHDDIPPAPPLLQGSAPQSPSGSVTDPTILGIAEPGTIVTLYPTADCSGAGAGEDDANTAGLFTVPVVVAPNSTTTYHAVAVDLAGNASDCSTTSFTYTHDDSAPSTPVLTGTNPTSPGSTNAPTITGTAEAGTTLTFYLKADCTGVAVGQGEIPPGGDFALPAILPANASVTVYASATDALAHVSPCSAGLPYIHDGKAPNPPILIETQPGSPGTTTAIVVRTQAEAGTTVRLFASADCQGPPLGNAPADAGFALIAATVPENAATLLSADAVDSAGNVSACSATPLEYIHDGLAPAAPVLTETAPPSPSSFLTPEVRGTAEALSRVIVFGTGDCTGTPLGEAIATDLGVFGVTASVAENTTTPLSAHAIDGAGLVSPCASGLSYTHDSSQPAVVVFFGTEPPSPSNATTTPLIRGASESGATVRLYLEADCSGLPVAQGATDAGGGFLLPVTVAKNDTTLVFGTSTDGAGNTGPCSPTPASFTHDDLEPNPPIIVDVTPDSPSAATLSPGLTIDTEGLATVSVYLNDCTGAPVATGVASASGAVSVAATVAPNVANQLRAQATDLAGNVSACGPVVVFVHDDQGPTKITLVGLAPTGPSSEEAPTLAGTTEGGAFVAVYQDALCSGAPVLTLTATANGTFISPTPVGLNQPTVLAATATDAAGNASPCSNSLTYLHDSLPPLAPSLVTTEPASPSTSLQPTVIGTAEKLSTVVLFADAACTVQLGGPVNATGTGAFSVGMATFLESNVSSSLYAQATDLADNVSPCSSPLVYVHDGVGPGTPVLQSADPPSPTRVTASPKLHGIADPASTVLLFVGNPCTDAPSATTTSTSSGAFAATVTVPENTETAIYALGEDSAGNPSGCSAPFLFTHDTVTPKVPEVITISPPSPSTDSTPTITFNAEPFSVVALFTNADCSGVPAAKGFVSDNGGVFLTPQLPLDASTILTALSADPAGNISQCSAPFVYVHDAAAPQSPEVLATVPSSPANVVLPTVSGSAEVGSTVQLFYDAACSIPVSQEVLVGAAGTWTISPLTPVSSNGKTGIRAKATDSAGNQSACSNPFFYEHDSLPPNPPALVSSTPPSPTSTTTTPTIHGTAEASSTVELYVGVPCSGSPTAVVLTDATGQFSGVVTVGANTGTLIFAAATDPSGNRSQCALPMIFIHDQQGPDGIALLGTDPLSPAINTNPKVLGSSEPGASVSLFASLDCSGPVVGTGTVGTDSAFAIIVPAALNATSTYTGKAFDAAGNPSPCSNPIEYAHDNTPPITPVLSPATPDSPSLTETTFTIPGIGDPGVRTLIYPLPDCGGAPAETLTSNADGTFTLAITIPPNTALTYSVSAVDEIGNVSACSNSVLIQHDNTAPNPPILTGSTPPSPGGSLTPRLLGTAEVGATVFLYLDPSCSAFYGAATIPPADGTFSFDVTDPLVPNRTITVYAQATDATGNPSLCSAPFAYTHDGASPLAPVITGTNPSSPNRLSTSPVVNGTAEGTAVVHLFVGAACTGNPAATATASAAGAWSMQIFVASNVTSNLYARATDFAGNVSPCSAPFAYVHDITAPTPIQITGVSPTSPNLQPSPTVAVKTEKGASIQVFAEANCAGSAVANGTADASGNASIQAAAKNNLLTTFTALATDAAGNTSVCSNPMTYTHDGLAPGAPTITSFTPKSPGSVLKPTANGTAEALVKVTLYSNDTCTVAISAAATAIAGNTFTAVLTQNVAANAPTLIYAQAVDPAGNPSICASGVPYVHDNINPNPPVVSSTEPPSPSSELRPTVKGTGEAGASIQFYKNATCTTALGNPGTVAADNTYAVKLSSAVGANKATTLYAKQTDAAGNASTCSTTFVSYTHDGSAPSSPTLTGTTPPSPSNSDTTPIINGKVDVGVVTVELYTGNLCQTLIATFTPGAGSTFAQEVTVTSNSNTTFSAKAVDAAGNKSGCSTPLIYRHDNTPPNFPVGYTGPTLTVQAGGTAQASWSAASDNFTPVASLTYEVCVTDKCGFQCDPWVPVVTTTPGKLNATLTNLLRNRRYFVLVRVRDEAGNLDANVKITSVQMPGTNIASGMTVGGAKSCAYGSDGTVECWGGGLVVDDVVVLAHGPNHWCGVYAGGSVGCAGENSSGALGNGSTAPSSTAVTVQLAAGGNLANVKSVSVGTGHSCALTVDGKVFCWGYNEHGAVGSQGGAQALKAVPVQYADGSALTGVVELASGSEHNCARLWNGSARCWGFNWAGQLGIGVTGISMTPVSVDVSVAHAFVDLALGTDHSCGLSVTGDVYCWGYNFQSQLGLGSGATSFAYAPTANGVTGARAIGAGGSHTCAVLGGGSARCWGNNENGQGGIDSAAVKIDNPTPVANLANALEIAGGLSHTCALLGTGEMYCWGANAGGQLGDTTTTLRRKPVAVAQLKGPSYPTQLSRGDGHACARLSDGTLRCWGVNDSAQCGTTASATPEAMAVITGLPAAFAEATGGAHSCAIQANGAIACFGKNDAGQLGNGSTGSPIAAPGGVTLPKAARSLALGGSHSCALLVDGTVYCWGSNSDGQLGTGGASSSPVKVALTDVILLAAGRRHTCALTGGTSAKLYCWGDNASGQLGVSGGDKNAPTEVTSAPASMAALSAGADHTCVVLATGVANCWGENGAGQLGDNSKTDRSSPVAVNSLTNARQISTGATHTCALLSDDSARCWGANGSGQLGNGGTTEALVPANVTNSSATRQIAAGDTSTCSLRYDGKAYCWGNNLQNLLGIGTSPFYTSPQIVQCLP